MWNASELGLRTRLVIYLISYVSFDFSTRLPSKCFRMEGPAMRSAQPLRFKPNTKGSHPIPI